MMATEKKNCRTIMVANARGGVGKTFLSIHLAYMLSELGKRVLLVDTDPQGTVGLWLNQNSPVTLYHLVMGECSLSQCLVRYRDKFDLILAKDYIKEAELRMVGMVGREVVVRNKFEEFEVHDQYDFVIFDTSPSLSLLNQNVYMASEEVIIPVNMEPLAIVGASSIIESMLMVRKHLRHHISLLGIAPTFVNSQTNVARQVLQLLTSSYDRVLPPLRASVKVKEASGSLMTINEYDSRNKIIDDLKTLVGKVIAGGGCDC